MDCVEDAKQCFAHNRQLVEQRLASLRAEVQALLHFRHARRQRPAARLVRPLIWPMYIFDKRRLVPLLKALRRELELYRTVENDLGRGELESAIEALTALAPSEETSRESILLLRDDLLDAQRAA